jgi:hypothetical protein
VASSLVDQFGPSIAVLGMHGDAQNSIPWNAQRRAFYTNFAGYPTWMIDGELDSWSGTPPWGAWKPDTTARLAVATDVTVDMSAVEGPTPDVWDVTATICIEPGGLGKTMRFYMAEALDRFPVGAHFTRNGIRQVAETADVEVASGACKDVTRTFTFDATSLASLENVSVIAWAQDDLDNGPAEVFQAHQLHWFPIIGGIARDGFELGDTSGWVVGP